MTRPYYYLGEGRGLTTLATGEIFFVDTQGRDVGIWILLAGLWETFVDDILCALVRPGDTFLDVGANVGYYSVKMASRVGPGGFVYSFEPNPRLHRFVQDNLTINGFAPRGLVVNAAAGAETGRSTLSFDPAMPGGGQVGLAEELSKGLSRIEVPVVRIDDVVPADRPVDLIKIDVEGFEPLVIGGMQGIMARSPNAAVVMEVAYAHWARHGDPAEILKGFAGDRRIFRIYHDGRIEELERAGLAESLNLIGVSYVLLLPPTDARWAQVKRFERGGPPSPEPAAASPQPLARPSLVARVRGRLARMIAP